MTEYYLETTLEINRAKRWMFPASNVDVLFFLLSPYFKTKYFGVVNWRKNIFVVLQDTPNDWPIILDNWQI